MTDEQQHGQPTRGSALDTWRDACDRLRALGEEVFAAPYPEGEAEHAEMIAHLAEQVVCWMNWSVFHADPRRPAFHRQNDLITQWGGPNADNVYRHARIDPARRYRIRGRMNSCEDWMLAIRRGFMHQPTWGTVYEVSAADLGIGAGDEFELTLGGAATDAAHGTGTGGPTRVAVHHVPLPEGAIMASFREYYLDWQAAEPAFMTIECLDDDLTEPAPRPSQANVAARIEDAIAAVEHSIRNWNAYLDDHRAGATDNVMALPMSVSKGLAAARYAFCFWNLADDEALVLETTVPDARYWSFQLYEMGTYELVDMVERQSSLNQRQVRVDADGRVRVVLAHRDPGVANWLDTAGRRVGQFTFRFFWPNGDPTFTSRVVRLADLDRELPDTERVTPTERADALAARRAHFAWRYRT